LVWAPWLSLAIVLLAVAGLPHAFNIIDGYNGLAGMVAVNEISGVQGKLTLDEAVLPRLALTPFSGGIIDPRWHQVTVRQLLTHTGGWDKKKSGDALFRSPDICRETGLTGPADGPATVRWMLGRRLDFAPGTAYAYCNFGYCLLGRLIEAVTGQSYGAAVKKLVLAPTGADGIALGLADRIGAGAPLYIMLEGDAALTLGGILREELHIASPLLVIDGLTLRDFDFVDIGRIRLPSGMVPVTIKSLLFDVRQR
jgi:hypothetical protein